MSAKTLSERTIAQLDKALKSHVEMRKDLGVVYKVCNDELTKGAIAPRLAAALLTSVQMQQALIVGLVNVLAEE